MPVESKTRTPVFGLTCTPGGIFIQLRQQSSILLKMPGGRLLLKSSLSPVRGVWEVRAETSKNPLSLSEIVLVRKAFMTHIAKGHLTLLKGKGTGENIPVAEAFLFVYKFTLVWDLILQHCWEQRGTWTESLPPLLRMQIFWFPSKWSLSTWVCRCPPQTKKPVKHG